MEPILINHEVKEEKAHKILGITWNHDADELSVVLSLQKICLSLNKRYWKWLLEFMIPLGGYHLSLSTRSCCFKRFARLKKIGMLSLVQTWRSLMTSGWLSCRKLETLEYRGVISMQMTQSPFQYSFMSSAMHTDMPMQQPYIRIEQQTGAKSVLVASKTRVGPLCGETIPDTRIVGTVVLGKLMKHVAAALSESLKVNKLRCWVDSTAVLYWIIGEKKQWKQFVENRIMEIRSLVSPSCWSYWTQPTLTLPICPLEGWNLQTWQQATNGGRDPRFWHSRKSSGQQNQTLACSKNMCRVRWRLSSRERGTPDHYGSCNCIER